MASKALRPLPVLFKELSEENRVRQRHIDLVVRPQARQLVRLRSAVTKSIRDLLDEEGFLEVETPVLQLVHGGAAARPFQTHLNAFDQDMTLRIALELHLKRVMVGGADRVYEIGRIFRNEGIDSSHSAEFSMLEFYAAWQDMTSVADLTRRLVQRAADVALGHRQLVVDGQSVDLDGPWRWAPFYDLVSQAVGEEIGPQTPAAALRAHCQARRIDHDPGWPAGKLALKLYSELVEKTLIQPTFVHHYPAVAQPLARQDQSGQLVQAWDLIIAGTERGTGFSELIDPVVQRQVLTEQSLKAAAGDPEAMRLDEDFLAALEVGAPPMGGVGLGIDRLLMLLGDVGIRETILFPLLRPAG
jgi:lysyl-tRNA synthetase class 2